MHYGDSPALYDHIEKDAQTSRGEIGFRKEVYTFKSPHTLYSLAWSYNPNHLFRLATGSCNDYAKNKIALLTIVPSTDGFVRQPSISQIYPSTKVMFVPDKTGCYPDLLATCGDYLRLYTLTDNGNYDEHTLSSYHAPDKCTPLTSFDWNPSNLSMIGIACIDTTCTIWNIETQQAVDRTPPRFSRASMQTKLVAHEREVLDIAFNPSYGGRDLFISSGLEGSIRLFDLRHLMHSTVIYESPERDPVCRVQWNNVNSNVLAFLKLNSKSVCTIDVRVPSKIRDVLQSHSNFVNAFSWSPHSASHLCTVADDCHAYIWDIRHRTGSEGLEPILCYKAHHEVNNVQWSSMQSEWIAVTAGQTLQVLRV